ncbi:MAG TPA: 2-dehydropantoate 2-reductase N-terminal domain-containing protein [Myxococcota bacterium]|jgi:2-dehydropantoate 2-reductase
MKVAVVGCGAVGSAFAFTLAKAGHDVTCVARPGARLQQLQAAHGVVAKSGTAATSVADALDVNIAYDLVIVTVLAPQVGAVLPALSASKAAGVLFMFNTFESLDPLRDAVGAARFAFGFPSILAHLHEGVLDFNFLTSGQITTVSDARWAKLFNDAGIGTVVHDDMHSWLRSHAAFAIPLMSIGCLLLARGGRALTMSEASAYARAWVDGFALVRKLGGRVTPSNVSMAASLPRPIVTTLLWAASRTQMVRDTGAHGPQEARMLIDQMTAAAPGQTANLLAIRP